MPIQGDGTRYSLSQSINASKDSDEDELDTISNNSNEDATDDDNDKIEDDDTFEEDIAVEELSRGKLTRCIVYGAEQSIPSKQRLAKVQGDELECNLDDETDPLQCAICKRSFTHTNRLTNHKCLGAVGKKDIVSETIRYGRTVLDQHMFEVINATTDLSTLEILSPVLNSDNMHQKYAFEPGWAATPDYGSKYGRKYIEPFKDDIDDMFTAGIENVAVRKGPGRMLAELSRRYPGRLDLPSEQEIRERITALTSKQKSGKLMCTNSDRGIPAPFMSTIHSIFKDNPSIAPQAAWDEFTKLKRSQGEYGILYPEQKRVKNKILALKVKYKQTGGRLS